MSEITFYSSQLCPFCYRAKSLLDMKGAAYNEISVDGQPAVREEMRQRAGRNSVPQIWIGERHVGGCDDLFLLERQGKLDELLSASA